MFVYSNIKFMLSLYDFTLRPVRFTTYIEGLGMPAAMQATLIAVCQSIGLVMGVLIGKWSDDTRTKWGRRKPFIAVAMPVGTLCFLLFCTPTWTVFTPPDAVSANCSNLIGDCTELESCLTSTFNISDDFPSGTIDAVPKELDVAYSNYAFMALWFGVLYTGYYTMIWNGVSIPYDALGIELTDDSERRMILFAVRAIVQIVGYMVPNILLIIVSGYFAEDVPLQYAILSVGFAILGLLGTVWILTSVNERTEDLEDEAPSKVPIVPQIRRLLANAAYRKYLALRAPLSIVGLLPTNMALFYIKFVLGREDFVSLNAEASIAGIFGILVGTYPVILLSKPERMGRGAVIFSMSGLMVVSWFVIFVLPGSYVSENLWIFYLQSFLVGLSGSAFFMLPDGLLADCVDYDELLTGTRSEAMYTVVETQLSLSIEILGGVLPLTLLQLLDFSNNGGCLCGCGTPCAASGIPYARWVCPGDVGFTCDGKFTSAPLFGGDRTAPCTLQSVVVQWGIKFFYVGLPAIAAILAMIPAATWPMTGKVNEDVMRELQLRAEDPTHVCTDPLTGEKVKPRSTEEKDLFKEHFTWREWIAAEGAGDREGFFAKLKALVSCQLFAFAAIAVGTFAVIFMTGDDAIRTIAILSFTLSIVLITWNYLRLSALKDPPAGASDRADSVATELMQS